VQRPQRGNNRPFEPEIYRRLREGSRRRRLHPQLGQLPCSFYSSRSAIARLRQLHYVMPR
jgi:hypothetical protein